MSPSTEVTVGFDLGTTRSKSLVRDLTGERQVMVEAPTPWTTLPTGTEVSAHALLDLVVELLNRAGGAAEQQLGPLRVLGVGVAGLGESGVLLDAAGAPCAPVIAWFDQRGTRQLQQAGLREPLVAQQFARRTGLPWDCQASLAKLLWLHDAGLTVTGAHRWASVPEWVVHRLGGRLVREPSLASRTGLVDQGTGDLWQDGVRAVGLPVGLLPPSVPAGRSVGTLRFAGLAPCLQGAALTVAGHDHPVAAFGAGAAGPDALFNSAGTADVVARTLPGVLDGDRRELLVAAGLSAGAHAVEGATLLLGGVRGGLLLRRVLAALGATTAPERERLDRAALAVGTLPAGLEVSGAGPTGDDVLLRMRDDAGPAEIWCAATRYTAAEAADLLAVIDRVVGPHRVAVASGGWTRMASVRAAKRLAIAHLHFSALEEPGVVGAALFAGRAGGVDLAAPHDLTATSSTTHSSGGDR